MNVSNLKLVLPYDLSPFEQRVNNIFLEEIELRSGIKLETTNIISNDSSYIMIRLDDIIKNSYPDIYNKINDYPVPQKEGFRLLVDNNNNKLQIIVAGKDDRGCLYGMARVLRKLYLKDGCIKTTNELESMSITPKYPLRGHQLAYRDKQNTLPTWDISQFDRYIRDLALFGSNSIEILPPRTDDNLFSSHFKKDPLEMMIDLSRVIRSYGMDVWVWYPNMGDEYKDPEKYKQELLERDKIFSTIPYIDNLLIPAGDPGDLHPSELFPITQECIKILHKHHPHARVWIAPQVFCPTPGWYDEFYKQVDKQPDWLYGICFAPWEQHTIQEMQKRLPEIYKNRIRHYPDITHNSSSQFELHKWDIAFALTQGREGNNTRPKDMKYIHNYHAPYTIGSLTYTEGIHDDVNKMVWGDQDFNPDMSYEETIKDYARLFIDPDYCDEIANILIDTEKNWIGKIECNKNIDTLYNTFINLDKKVSDSVRNNYRYQMALLRVISDYQIKLRAINDKQLEAQALDLLSQSENIGVDKSIEKARTILRKTFDNPIAISETHTIQKLADELRSNCGIRLTTLRHGAQSWIRGAILDSLQSPLNDYYWYMLHFNKIENLCDEKEKLDEIQKLINSTNVTDDCFYDWFGNPDSFDKRVVKEKSWEQDPGHLTSPALCHDPYGIQMLIHQNKGWYTEFPISIKWTARVRTLYGTPLKMIYDNLNPSEKYKIKITYPDVLERRKNIVFDLHFWAGDILIHSKLKPNEDSTNPIFEFDLPCESYKSGSLELKWKMTNNLYPLSISEIWILKQ